MLFQHPHTNGRMHCRVPDAMLEKPKDHEHDAGIVVPAVAMDDGVGPSHGLFRIFPWLLHALLFGRHDDQKVT